MNVSYEDLKTNGIIDTLFKTKVRENGSESDYTEEEYNRFCTQLERGYPFGTLDFTSQQISVNILMKLTKVIRESKHLRSFRLYGNLIGDHGMHSLYQLMISSPRVTILDIGCNDLTNQSVPVLVDIIHSTRLKSLQLGALGMAWHSNKFNIQSIIDILEACLQSRRMQCIGLNGLKMSLRQGAKRVSMAGNLASFIRNNVALRSISISDCGFTPRDMEIVTLDGLLANNRLKFLDIHNSPLSDPVGPDFLRKLSNMRRLTYLDMSNCQLSPNAGVQLARSLKSPNSLIVLNLSNNQIGDQGFKEILSILLNNNTLTELDVTNNYIGYSVSALLAKVIAQNQVLASLNLSSNMIGDDGAFAIASSIDKNESITSLSIASCRISDEGAIEICKALVNNHCLRKLSINDNFLTRESGYQIIDALRGNEHLFVLDLTATQIDHFVIKAAVDLCIRNRQIQKQMDLQPLKQQLIQLSIQQTKMPEAEMRLRNLENTLDDVIQKIVQKEGEIEVIQMEADSKINKFKKDISDVEQMIQEEQNAMETLENENQKMQKDFDERYKAILADTEKEKAIISKLEKDSDDIDANMKKFSDEHEKKKESINKEIEDLQKLLDQTLEIMNDPDAVRHYTAPKLDFLIDDDYDPLFLVDQIDDLRQGKRKKSPKKKGGKKKKGGAKKKK